MALSLQLGYPDVPRSITNPNVNKKDTLDVNGPLPFLTFIKLINVSFDPDTLQDYYNHYISAWNAITTVKTDTDEKLIVDNYKNFLRELTLNFTTLEEKQFLTKIDFNDPLDLDVALGFYGRKLREITQYYNNKRNDIKFDLIRNKLKGTNFGAERTIIELTLHYLKSLDEGKILFDYEAVKSLIEVEIQEMFDTYPLYFNQTPDESIYDNKDLDYGMNIFLQTNEQLIDTFTDLSQELINLKELDDLFDNKRELTRKNVFTDFYFLSTGNTVNEFLSGKLFESFHTVNVFSNRDYPTSASTEQDCCIITPREKGFFRPFNTAIVLLDGENGTFSYNLSNLEPNKLYYFPDPKILGHNGEVITFIVDDSFLKKHISSGNAVNQPSTSPYDTKYYGYVSQHNPNLQKNLDMLFDIGYIKDSKKDIYGNLFGLFQNNGENESVISLIPEDDRINLIINGYVYFDVLYLSGYNFNYFEPDSGLYVETIRSGLSSYTNGFTYFVPDITIVPGAFVPYTEPIAHTENNALLSLEILEGAYISKYNFEMFPETFSSDLSAFSTDPGEYYFSDLIEAGAAQGFPFIRPLVDPLYPSLTANDLQFVVLSDFTIYDGADFGSPVNFSNPIPEQSYFYSDDLVGNTEFYVLSNLPAEFNSKLFVKNSTTRVVDTITAMLPYLTIKYAPDIIAEIDNNIKRFEVTTDTLIIETLSCLIFEKIKYEDGQFVNPKVVPINLIHNTGLWDKVSNRFKVGNNIFYCHFYTTSPNTTTGTVTIYPRIYKFDTINFKNDIIFEEPLDIFTIISADAEYTHVDAPTLTYNSRNNIFKLSYLLKDTANIPTLFEFDFSVGPTVEFLARKEYLLNYSNAIELSASYPPTTTFYLSSGPTVSQSFSSII